MLSERRKDRRHNVNQAAKFQFEVGALKRDCIITDISKSGARICVVGVKVPDTFALLISGAQDTRRECRVVWRLGDEIGLEFISPPRLDRRQ